MGSIYYADRRKGKRTLQMQSMGKEAAKNATRLQKHLDICSLWNSTINEASNSNKKRKQSTSDDSNHDQSELESQSKNNRETKLICLQNLHIMWIKLFK